MQIKFTTDDMIIYEQCDDFIVINGEIGGYRQIGDENEFFFYSEHLTLTDDDKLKFENRVKELVYKTNKFIEGAYE